MARNRPTADGDRRDDERDRQHNKRTLASILIESVGWRTFANSELCHVNVVADP